MAVRSVHFSRIIPSTSAIGWGERRDPDEEMASRGVCTGGPGHSRCLRAVPAGSAADCPAGRSPVVPPHPLGAGRRTWRGGWGSSIGHRRGGERHQSGHRPADGRGFRALGAACLLREEDISLHDPEAGTLREKKVSDLHNRAAAVEALEGATLVSIHQNSYPQSRYHGTQVFFAPTEGSQQLAEAIQQGVQGTLQLENRRAAKQIAGNVYLMNHVDNRAVLVECGFLSNPEEERALRDPEYQTRMAAVLAWVCLMDTGAVPS